MRISKTTAMRIVTELKSIINQDLTFMDTTCHIIACTEEERVGSFHGATKRMLDEGIKVLVVRTNDEYEGTHSGVNLTLEYEDQTVGVIGITGEYGSVEKYGQIIKKMTEILLMSEALKAQKLQRDNTRNRFVHQWLFGGARQLTPEFCRQGLGLGVDVTIPRRVAVASAEGRDTGPETVTDQGLLDDIARILKNRLRQDPRNVWSPNGSQFILQLAECGDQQLLQRLGEIQRDLLDQHGVLLRFGVDSTATWEAQSHDGCMRAEKALLRSQGAGSRSITFYREIGVEIFLREVSYQAKLEFIHKIFAGCTDEEIRRWTRTLAVLFAQNGSIGRTAQELFLHKNTLQYRLNKLRETTGHDPRSMEGASLFYIAMAFWNSLDL